MYVFTDLKKIRIFDEKFKQVSEYNVSYQDLLKNIDALEKNELTSFEKEIEKKIKKELKKPKDYEQLGYVVSENNDFNIIRNFCLENTKIKLKNSVSTDLIIIQVCDNLGELDKIINLLSKRIREWFSLYLPELVEDIDDNEKLIDIILYKNKDEIMKKINIKETVGADLKETDVQEIIELAKLIKNNFDIKNKHINYLETLMKNYCPNLLAVGGVLIGSRLIARAGSLKRLSEMPSSTLQLLGAEKALFRHLRKKTKPPKYGVLVNHPVVINAKEKGKAARVLASMLNIAAKVDYFKGEFIGDKLLKELESKLKK